MTTETQWRPGPYPTLYACRYCKAVVKRKEIVAGRAKELGDTTCVCPACLPRWQKQQRRRNGQPSVADNDNFVALIAAAQDDSDIRKRVVVVAKLDPFNRESVLNTLVSDLRLRGAPQQLIAALECLKDDDIALKTVETLGTE
jgi:hypothetical protein